MLLSSHSKPWKLRIEENALSNGCKKEQLKIIAKIIVVTERLLDKTFARLHAGEWL